MEKAQQYARPAHLSEKQWRELRSIWNGMRWRCRTNHPNYGGRGITVSEPWHDFETFARDMGPRPSRIHSIDRIDVDKGYSKENCRWADPKQQAANKRPVPRMPRAQLEALGKWRIVFVNGKPLKVRPDSRRWG